MMKPIAYEQTTNVNFFRKRVRSNIIRFCTYFYVCFVNFVPNQVKLNCGFFFSFKKL
ncbi:hypothetical protein HanRHA438_Chr09g0394611 [Helianthus annuus]|nr:hypothetical protein HanRHA438_Chr09g0394611 [Helianthus annuus]